MSIPFPLIAFGEQRVASSLAAIVVAAVPLIGAVLALRYDPSEKPTRTRAVGLLIGFGGVIVLVGIQVAGSSGELLGTAALLLASVGYAIGPMLIKLRLGGLEPSAAMGGSLAIASVLLAPAAVLDLPSRTPAAGALISVVVLGVVCTAAAFVIFTVLIREAGTSRATVITYINPVIAVALGVTLLGERPGFGAAAGLLLILAGSWLGTGGHPPKLPPRGRRREILPERFTRVFFRDTCIAAIVRPSTDSCACFARGAQEPAAPNEKRHGDREFRVQRRRFGLHSTGGLMQTELANPATEQPGPALPSEPPAIAASEVRPVTMPLVDRLASAVITGVPPVMVLIGMYFGWTAHMLVWQDLLVLGVLYCGVGAGVTVGFHRLFTHRSFKTSRPMRAFWAILGSMAAEGPVIDWVATHRKHHRYSDQDGDPHSPHLHERSGWRGEISGLAHAHLGWVFSDMEVADENRYAKDLLNDPWVKFVDRTFVVWVIAGLGVAFGLGVALTGTIDGGLTALLWGGAARIFFVHHATFSINSLCHYFGKQELRHGRRVPEPRVARDPDVGRVVAQQPPRVPDRLPPRPEALADRPVGDHDPRHGDVRSGLGCRARRPREAQEHRPGSAGALAPGAPALA